MNKTLLIIIVILVAIGGFFMSTYNGMVTLGQTVDSQWAQVDNQLQRRNDLIPNLVNTVKGYAAHEEGIMKDVSDARARLAGASGVGELAAANDQLTGALGRLLAISENYPNLKADSNFRALQDELAGTENRIAVARRDYNNSVQVYETKIRSFPTNIIAGMFGFGNKEYFKVDEGAKKTPTVKF